VTRTLVLAGSSFWAAALLPFLKYPANPPGVGDPSTIDFRQHIYLGMLVGAIVVVALAFGAQRAASARYGVARATLLAVAVLGLGSAGLYLALPADTDPIRMPLALVSEFRLHSLAGLGLFWAALGGFFGPLVAWLGQARPAAQRAAGLPADAIP
jgi:hypothetical protein